MMETQKMFEKMTETFFINWFPSEENVSAPENWWGTDYWQKMFFQEKEDESADMVQQMMEKMMQQSEFYQDFGTSLQQMFGPIFEKKSSREAEQLTEKLMSHFMSVYRDNFGAMLKLPQMGLSREHTQKVVQTMDVKDQLLEAFGQFMIYQGIPFREALEDLNEQLQKKSTEGQSPNAQEIYKQAVDVLEAHYSDFFKTPGFTKSLNEVIEKSLDYTEKSHDLIEDFLKPFPIAVRSEIEEIYQSMHDLKKKNRSQENRLQEQAEQLQSQQAQIETLQKQLETLGDLQAEVESIQKLKMDLEKRMAAPVQAEKPTRRRKTTSS